MRKRLFFLLAGCASFCGAASLFARPANAQNSAPPAAVAPATAPAPPRPLMPPYLVPARVVDLMTPEGSGLFGAEWKSMEAKIVEGPALAGHMPGYEKSYDIQPHAGESGFDDSSWPVIGAKGLADRRGGGRVSFIWYRANLTIPGKSGISIRRGPRQ